ncbi:MAG: acetyl-CoA carboxylase biotin carboxyl carrier protein subunit [Acidobacteria bacterium]|nr:acetyl-CoA carboxylase biotin carboxyl carrier protein subunit [Acidobacteriota bacterium]
MKFHVEIAGQKQTVELRRGDDGWTCVVNGKPRTADVVEVAPRIFSLLLDGESFELYVERVDGGYRVHSRGADLLARVQNPRRWQGRAGGSRSHEGPQPVTAPMPGKVVRVLVEEKQAIEEGEGLVVVEAMKMQNEISAPKKGVVEKVLVQAGDTVDHGDTLLIVG